MDNYEQIKQHLLSAGNLIAPNANAQLAIVNIVKNGESNGVDTKQIIKNLLSHMHLVLTHGKEHQNASQKRTKQEGDLGEHKS